MVQQTQTGTVEINGNATNYCQMVPLTFEERVNLYMRCTKLELAKMLAERDRNGMDMPYIPSPFQFPGPIEPIKYEITCDEMNRFATTCSCHAKDLEIKE